MGFIKYIFWRKNKKTKNKKLFQFSCRICYPGLVWIGAACRAPGPGGILERPRHCRSAWGSFFFTIGIITISVVNFSVPVTISSRRLPRSWTGSCLRSARTEERGRGSSLVRNFSAAFFFWHASSPQPGRTLWSVPALFY